MAQLPFDPTAISTGRTAQLPTPGGNLVRLPDFERDRLDVLETHAQQDRGRERQAMLFAVAADILAGVGGKVGTAVGDVADLSRKRRAEEGKLAVEDRKARQAELDYRLNVAKFMRESQQGVPATLETYLKSVKTIRNEMALSSPEARDNAIKGLRTGAKEAGLDFVADLIPSLVNAQVDVTATLPDLSRHIADNPAGVVFQMNAKQLLDEDPTGKKFLEAGQAFAAPSIQRTIDARMPEVVDTLKRDPAYQGKSISFETVVSLVAGNDAAVRQYLLGQGGAPKEVHDGILKRMATLGVQTPDIGAKAAETEATELAKTTPAVTAGKATQEKAASEAKKLGELTPGVISRETDRAGAIARAQEGVKGPPLSQGVKDAIQGLGVDPRALDPSRPVDAALIRKARAQIGEEEVKQQEKLEPGRVRVARQTGAAAAEVAEQVRRDRTVPADAAALIGLTKGSTIGNAEDRGIKVPQGPELAQLKAFKVFTEQAQEIIRELDSLIAKSPEAIGTSGRVTALVGGVKGQAENFARLSGVQVEGSLNPKDYDETFRGLGITNARMQSNVIALAFPLAVAAQGSTGRISDKDVEFQIRRIGAQVQDPVAFRAVLADVEAALSRSFDRQIETATGAPRASAGGAAKGPAPADIERMPIGRLKTLDPKALNAAQRKALDRALRRLGF